MASQAYMENMALKKQKQVDQMWKSIGENSKLKGLALLHERIKDVEKSRNHNKELLEETN